MNAYSSDFHPLTCAAEYRANSITMRWAALHNAAAAVASLAQLPPEQLAGEPRSGEALDFAAIIARLPDWKASLLDHGLDDVAAFMQSGLAALIAVKADGREPAAAAAALWAEFDHARASLLDLLSGS